jgi:hypothetical protein
MFLRAGAAVTGPAGGPSSPARLDGVVPNVGVATDISGSFYFRRVSSQERAEADRFNDELMAAACARFENEPELLADGSDAQREAITNTCAELAAAGIDGSRFADLMAGPMLGPIEVGDGQ